MSKTIKIRLKPLEPFFFGDDRGFPYGEGDKKRIGRSSYYVRSMNLPLQTTLFGTLRYLGIAEKHSSYRLTAEDTENIGGSSFDYFRPQQSFGRIEGISSLYLENAQGDLFIRAPLDHNMDKDTKTYQPFTFSETFIKTAAGERLLPKDYKAKCGLADAFLCVTDGNNSILHADRIFHEEEDVGIGIWEKAYFKMQFVRMEKGFSFVYFATLRDGFPEIKDHVVFMGRRKSAFAVETEPAAEPLFSLPGFAGQAGNEAVRKCYLLSDTCLFAGNDAGTGCISYKVSDLEAVYSVTQTLTARAYQTIYCDERESGQKGRFQKSEKLLRLLRAGSVFWYRKENEETFKKMFENSTTRVAGLNQIKIGGE